MSSGKDVLLGEIERMAGDSAASQGVEVVDLVYRPQGKYTVLRIDIDRPGIPGVGLEECEAYSRDLEPRLDELEGLPDGYELQVSSPGADRPIRTDDDFRRNTGRRVLIETAVPITGRKSFVGCLVEAGAVAARLRSDEDEVLEIPRSAITFARQDLEFPRPRDRARGRSGSRGTRGIV